MNKIRVVELFAGVGGFRLGLEGWKGKSASSDYKKKMETPYEVVWSNQWEPSTKLQHASKVYEARFGKKGHSNEDISKVTTSDIPNHDLLVGGFPCQDYSVARTLSQSAGIVGKKGVLWWEIYRILKEKGERKPKFLMLENVDRLIKSPANQRGRDFAIILSSLAELGYMVEWRVINAADYGMPQKRRRTFILGYHYSSKIKIKDAEDWVLNSGTIAKSFPVSKEFTHSQSFELDKDLINLSENFNRIDKIHFPFHNSGIMVNWKVLTISTKPSFSGRKKVLGDIIMKNEIPTEYYLNDNEMARWKYLKKSKNEPRRRRDGEIFYYSEGSLPWPDSLDSPSRTIITSEGGRTPSRFKHVIEIDGVFRRLTPIELERLNMFPDDHTIGEKDTKRAFFMGNALVVGVIEKLGFGLAQIIASSRVRKKPVAK